MSAISANFGKKESTQNAEAEHPREKLRLFKGIRNILSGLKSEKAKKDKTETKELGDI